MKFDIKWALGSALLLLSPDVAWPETMRESVLRAAVVRGGLLPASELQVPTDPELVSVGHKLFQSRLLSHNLDTACASCHVDRFGSSDGIPIALGTGASGFGNERIRNGGDIIPRNAQALWGRGGNGFDIFFSDGRVTSDGVGVQSQFGQSSPSEDPLIVSIHLPSVEIGEMLSGDISQLQTETVESANLVYELIANRVIEDELLGRELAIAVEKQPEEISFLDIATALAHFIRFNFAIDPTKLHRFTFSDGDLTENEINGGLLFYGRGGCSTCHNGPYFSDFRFYALPFPQFGFGANGFGVDYGRFNVTLDVNDLYSFRTPPLYDVLDTAPYSHSGSVYSIEEAILYHVDPLRFIDTQSLSTQERVDYYERLSIWADTPLNGVFLSDNDVEDLVSFLNTLDMAPRLRLEEID